MAYLPVDSEKFGRFLTEVSNKEIETSVLLVKLWGFPAIFQLAVWPFCHGGGSKIEYMLRLFFSLQLIKVSQFCPAVSKEKDADVKKNALNWNLKFLFNICRVVSWSYLDLLESPPFYVADAKNSGPSLN